MIEFIAPPKYANALRGTAHVLSLSRIALALLIYYLVTVGGDPVISLLIFVVAEITDWADGVVARMSNEPSKFGAFLDPVCDKAMFIIVLVAVWSQIWSTPKAALAAIALVVTEIIFFSIAAIKYKEMTNEDAKSNMFGKVKMVFECLALSALILHWDGIATSFLIPAALFCAVMSGAQKLYDTFPTPTAK